MMLFHGFNETSADKDVVFSYTCMSLSFSHHTSLDYLTKTQMNNHYHRTMLLQHKVKSELECDLTERPIRMNKFFYPGVDEDIVYIQKNGDNMLQYIKHCARK